MNESIKKMYEQEPKTWYAKIIEALIVAALLAWSLSTVQSTGSNGSGLSVAGKIISGIFHPFISMWKITHFDDNGITGPD